eukprot:25711-Eustigmatos_ZCMA.PRE.1
MNRLMHAGSILPMLVSLRGGKSASMGVPHQPVHHLALLSSLRYPTFRACVPRFYVSCAMGDASLSVKEPAGPGVVGQPLDGILKRCS